MSPIPNTTMCFIRRQNHPLMLKKGRGRLTGRWLAIGGHFDLGETPEECVRREAREETGLLLEALNFRGIITFVTDCPEQPLATNYAFVFECHIFSGQLGNSAEGVVAWIPDGELFHLDSPKKEQIFPLIYDNDKLFSAKIISCAETISAYNINFRS